MGDLKQIVRTEVEKVAGVPEEPSTRTIPASSSCRGVTSVADSGPRAVGSVTVSLVDSSACLQSLSTCERESSALTNSINEPIAGDSTRMAAAVPAYSDEEEELAAKRARKARKEAKKIKKKEKKIKRKEKRRRKREKKTSKKGKEGS